MQLYAEDSCINELDDISQMEDYSELLDWDFVMGKEGNWLGNQVTACALSPRKKVSQAQHRGSAWSEARAAGFRHQPTADRRQSFQKRLIRTTGA